MVIDDLYIENDFCNDCGRMEPDNPCVCAKLTCSDCGKEISKDEIARHQCAKKGDN